MASAESDQESREKAEDPLRQFTSSVEHLRSTAKWILVAYAAVGGVLIAGSQLSSIGEFKPDDPRLWVAIVAVGVALGSIAFAVHLVIKVQTVGKVTLTSLATDSTTDNHWAKAFIEDNRALLAGYRSVDALQSEYNHLIQLLHTQNHSKNPDERKKAKATGQWVTYLGAIVSQLLAAARFEQVDREFREELGWKLIALALLAGVAVGVFAWAANPKDSPPSDLFRIPAAGTLTLSDERREQLASILGTPCATGPIDVAILGVTDSSYDIVIPPRSGCDAARLMVSYEEVMPSIAVELLPTPTFTPAATPDAAATGRTAGNTLAVPAKPTGTATTVAKLEPETSMKEATTPPFEWYWLPTPPPRPVPKLANTPVDAQAHAVASWFRTT